MLVFLKLVADFGAEGIRTHALRRAKAARYFAGSFRGLQNSCKQLYSCVDAFPSISGDLLGLLHGCCTDVVVCIRIMSGKVVIRPAAWSSLMRASC